MPETKKIAKAYELLSTAQASLDLAMKLLGEVSGADVESSVGAARYTEKAADLKTGSAAGGKVIEGVFDGQGMVDKKGNTFPVPANYASKSKLIPGDVLKLTVTEEGKFLYKQIGPVERKTVVGPLVHKDGQYMILANGKSYKVLLASVTYFRASVGDEVTVIIPANEDSDWAAIEAVLPKFDDVDMGSGAMEDGKKTRVGKKKTEIDLETELDI